jgi:hypothetical protein
MGKTTAGNIRQPAGFPHPRHLHSQTTHEFD